MTGNGRLSDYLAKYDKRKNDEAAKALELAQKGVALAAAITSRIDVALDKGGKEGETFVYSLTDNDGVRRNNSEP